MPVFRTNAERSMALIIQKGSYTHHSNHQLPVYKT